MGKLVYCGEEWQLTNRKGGRSRSTERGTDRIKVDWVFKKEVVPVKEVLPKVKRLDQLREYRVKGANKSIITWRGGSITIFRLLTIIGAKRMFPTKKLRSITYIK